MTGTCYQPLTKMRSLRIRIAVFNIIAMFIAIVTIAVIGVVSVGNFGHESVEKELILLSETGKNNINYYLKSVEQSVNTISYFVDDDLSDVSDETFDTEFSEHVDVARNIFSEAAKTTNGVLTYYYRIDPEVTKRTNEKGFWYTNLDGKGFVEHEVTDLSDDKNEARWFYRPKETGEPLWLAPYITDGLTVYVISYNVPIYRGENHEFIGVIGIELSYNTLGEQIKNITILESGYAFVIENENGTIIYHPYIDILEMPEEERPIAPKGFIEDFKSGKHHSVYTFQGVEKHAYWTSLSNDMSIVVCVPHSEINRTWQSLALILTFVSLGIVALFTTLIVISSRKITKPLEDLTLAAEEINKGNYDVKLDYKKKDEIGVLTETFNNLIGNLEGYINDLSSLAYADALTSMGNKSAFDLEVEELEKRMKNKEEKVEFAIAILDCDNLKDINDEYGHEKGDIYLRNSCNLMSRIFNKSKIYRIGGDEFAIILEGEDYKNRDKLRDLFLTRSKEVCSFAKNPWEKIKVSIGIADYDPKLDKKVNDVVVHADHLMYSNKRERKKLNQ